MTPRPVTPGPVTPGPERRPERGRAPAPDTGPGGSAAQGFLQASQLLRRRIHRFHRAGMGDEQALLAVCGVLDALARDSAAYPDAMSGAVTHAVERLVDQLHRANPPLRR